MDFFLVEVLVEFDYTAEEPDELTIKKGDIIKDVSQKSGKYIKSPISYKSACLTR